MDYRPADRGPAQAASIGPTADRPAPGAPSAANLLAPEAALAQAAWWARDRSPDAPREGGAGPPRGNATMRSATMLRVQRTLGNRALQRVIAPTPAVNPPPENEPAGPEGGSPGAVATTAARPAPAEPAQPPEAPSTPAPATSAGLPPATPPAAAPVAAAPEPGPAPATVEAPPAPAATGAAPEVTAAPGHAGAEPSAKPEAGPGAAAALPVPAGAGAQAAPPGGAVAGPPATAAALPLPRGVNAVAQRIVEQVGAAATLARTGFLDRHAERATSLTAGVRAQQQALLAEGARQAAALREVFAGARSQVGGLITGAQAQLQGEAATQRAALDAWRVTAAAQAQTQVTTHQAAARALGDRAAEQTGAAAEGAAQSAQTRIQAAAQQARAVGNQKSTVRGNTPEATQAKAKVAVDLASDTAGKITEGLTELMADLRGSAPTVAADYRRKAQDAASGLGSALPSMTAQIDQAHQGAAGALQQILAGSQQALGRIQAQLAAGLAQQEQQIQGQLQALVAQKNTELETAGQQAAAALEASGRKAADAGDAEVVKSLGHLAAMPIDARHADEVATKATGQIASAYAGLNGQADAGLGEAQGALEEASEASRSALAGLTTAAGTQVGNLVAQAQGQIGQITSQSGTQLGAAVTQTSAAGDRMLGDFATGLQGQNTRLDQGFTQSLGDYRRGLDDKVAAKVTAAQAPVSSLSARIDTAQLRAEEQAHQGWLRRQLGQLWDMLADPGFWAALVVGLVLAVIVIALLPEELTGLALLAVAFLAFAAVGAIAAAVGTVVSNLTHHRPTWENFWRNVGIGALMGGILGALGVYLVAAGASTLTLIAVISLVSGVLTVITNVATKGWSHWDDNLLANMLLAGLLAWAGKFVGGLRGRGGGEPGPPVVDPNAPPVVDPNAPPVVDPNAPPVVDPNAPPVVDPNAPPVVDPNAPPRVVPRPYDPALRTDAELQQDIQPAPRAGETPDEAQARVRAAEDEIQRRWAQTFDELGEHPPRLNVRENDGAHHGDGAHTIERHGPEIPLRRVDAPGGRTVEGRVYGDPPWPQRSNWSYKWLSESAMNRTVNDYIRANWDAIRNALAVNGNFEATFDAGNSVGEGFFNENMTTPQPRNAVYHQTSNVTLTLELIPGHPPSFFIVRAFPRGAGLGAD